MALIDSIAHLAATFGFTPIFFDFPYQCRILERRHRSIEISGTDVKAFF